MELSRLKSAASLLDNLIIVPMMIDGEPVDLTINIDVFTSEYWRKAQEWIRDRYLGSKAQAPAQDENVSKQRAKKRATAAARKAVKAIGASTEKATLGPFEDLAVEDDVERAIFVDLLTKVPIAEQSPALYDWDMTVEGEHVKPTPEILLAQPTPAVKAIWRFIRRQALTVKKLGTLPTNARPMTEETSDDGSSTED